MDDIVAIKEPHALCRDLADRPNDDVINAWASLLLTLFLQISTSWNVKIETARCRCCGVVAIPQPLISLHIGIRYLLNWRILHLGSQMSYNWNLQKIHSSEWLLTEFDLRWWVPIHASSTEFHNHYGHRLFRLLYCSNFPCWVSTWIFNSITMQF